jgi:hypothetical protein
MAKYVACVSHGVGITTLIRQRLMIEAAKYQDPKERMVSLISDEMAIKDRMCYSRTEDMFHGLENTSNENYIGKKPHLANKLLCFVIHGFCTKYTIPAAYYFSRSITGKRLYEITKNILQVVTGCGFNIIRLVGDNHKSNVALFRHFGNGSLKTSIPHPIVEGLKNIYNLQKDMIIKPVKFLTRKHIKPNTFEKMNVLRAIQIFSPVITNLLIYLQQNATSRCDFSNTGATINFMHIMYRFFKIHDASDRQQHIHQLDPDSAPYKQITDERLNWLKTDFPKYIQDLQHASKNCNMKALSNETAEALIFTSQSTFECINYLLHNGFYYVLTRRFSSDPIESLFSSIRLGGGSNDMTDARAAEYAIKKMLQTGIIIASDYGNVVLGVV